MQNITYFLHSSTHETFCSVLGVTVFKIPNIIIIIVISYVSNLDDLEHTLGMFSVSKATFLLKYYPFILLHWRTGLFWKRSNLTYDLIPVGGINYLF